MILIETNKKLCPYDIISYGIDNNEQQLVVHKEVIDRKYIVEILSNNDEEILSNNYIEGVKCYKLFNILGGKNDPCNHTEELIVKSIRYE